LIISFTKDEGRVEVVSVKERAIKKWKGDDKEDERK